MPKLELRQVFFRYDEKPLLDNISLRVEAGEFVSLLGASGSGKSTILNLLAGFVRPDAGEMTVDGQAISGMTGHFAYMPQNDLLLKWRTILDNVCLYADIHGEKEAAKKVALQNLPAFGLSGYQDAYPDELSGGMRQRAAFLRTALCAADIMLLDEPFGALDVISRGDMQDWLNDMRAALKRTTLLVTHDIDEAIYLSDRIYVLGGTPSRIVREVCIDEKARTRDWLYEQGALRKLLHGLIRGERS
ncbi:MAG: ABC transporter ATP-binding protein [Clostridia bacterium]